MAKRKRTRVSLAAPTPLVGDHGTGTSAATASTVLEPIKDEKGRNPNNMGRRRRVSQIDRLKEKLTMRQIQAAEAICDAYQRVEMLSSGSPLKERVQASPKPDATIDMQVSAQSWLAHVMRGVPGRPEQCREVIEHICWYNRPVSDLATGRKHVGYMAMLKVSLDLVANRLGY